MEMTNEQMQTRIAELEDKCTKLLAAGENWCEKAHEYQKEAKRYEEKFIQQQNALTAANFQASELAKRVDELEAQLSLHYGQNLDD
jgi:uncharacterized coiled-coil DUF342 family protein